MKVPSSMFWALNCGMLGLEKWEQMGRTGTVESTDPWLAKVQVDLA